MTTYIYIVEIEENATGARTYVGITNDLHRRFNEESKRGWLSRQVRIRMAYCDSRLYQGTPRETERWIKGWSQRHKLQCIDEAFRGNGAGEAAWRPFWHRCPDCVSIDDHYQFHCDTCNDTGGVFD